MKTLFRSSTVVRSLIKFVCLNLFICLFACEHVVIAPKPELVHINNEPPTINPQLPHPSTSLVDSTQHHIDPQPKKPDQTLL